MTEPHTASNLPMSNIRRVASAYLWANGMHMVFDHQGEQIPELQGLDTPARRLQIKARSDERTLFRGWGPDMPLQWGPTDEGPTDDA